MRLRQHRGGFVESMATVIDIEPTRAALVKAIQDAALEGLSNVTEDRVIVAAYNYDYRNGWDTHIVTIQDWGPYGFTDGPLTG